MIMSNDTQELKRCPFCGGSAVDKKTVDFHGIMTSLVGCKDCAAFSPFKRDKSAEAWNTRPIEDKLCKEVQRLRMVITDFCNAHQNIEGYNESEIPHQWYDFLDAFDALKKEKNDGQC